jgi:RHS repeat-associated protein
VPGDHRFLGATRDQASGLTLLGARYHDPVLGRFLSVDPVLDVSIPAHLNAYSYGFNNPVTFSDASGLEPKDKDGNYDGAYYGSSGGGSTGAPPGAGGQQQGPDWLPWNWSPDTWQNVAAVAAGIGVAVGVTALVIAAGACTVVTFGVCGVGAAVVIGAVIAGGAVGSLVTYQLSTGEKTSEGRFNALVTGGVAGAVGGVAGPALGPLASSALSKIGAAAASRGTSALEGTSATTLGQSANALSNRAFSASLAQLQSKFKHAVDFGVEGNFNSVSASRFADALESHVGNPSTQVINGTYRGSPVIHYLDEITQLDVVTKPSGEFITGWRLSGTQLWNVLNRGSL